MHIYTRIYVHICLSIYLEREKIQRVHRESIRMKTPNYIYIELFSAHD